MNLHIVKTIMDRGSAFVLMVIVVMVRKKFKLVTLQYTASEIIKILLL